MKEIQWEKVCVYDMQRLSGVFLKTLAAYGKSFLLKRQNLMLHLPMILSQKQKAFSEFCLYFRNLGSILNISKKAITLIADVFLNLRIL